MTITTSPDAPPLVLAIIGRIGAGKDTAARILEDQYAFEPIGFADPLLDMACTLANHVDVDGAWCIERELKDEPMPVLGLSYRQFARTVADALRANDPAFFARIAAYRARQAIERGNNVVFTDLRYPQEAAAIAALGAYLVRITRPDADAAPNDGHSSEQHIDTLQAQYGIDNSGSGLALGDQIDWLVAEMRNVEVERRPKGASARTPS